VEFLVLTMVYVVKVPHCLPFHMSIESESTCVCILKHWICATIPRLMPLPFNDFVAHPSGSKVVKYIFLFFSVVGL
jgi:hypothetical protein